MYVLLLLFFFVTGRLLTPVIVEAFIGRRQPAPLTCSFKCSIFQNLKGYNINYLFAFFWLPASFLPRVPLHLPLPQPTGDWLATEGLGQTQEEPSLLRRPLAIHFTDNLSPLMLGVIFYFFQFWTPLYLLDLVTVPQAQDILTFQARSVIFPCQMSPAEMGV